MQQLEVIVKELELELELEPEQVEVKTIIEENVESDIPYYKSNIAQKTVLVLSGGGVKGIAHIGVLKALEQLRMLKRFHTFAGTSIGSVILGLHLVGYKPDEIKEFIIKFDLNKIKSINILGVLDSFGIDKGDKLQYVLERLISAKNIDPFITLDALHKQINKTFYFTTVCLNTGLVEYLSHENFPDLPFVTALRMSSAIPWYYSPISYNSKLYVDGGCIDNYPVCLFKDRIEDVVGVYLLETHDVVEQISNIETVTLRIFQCFMTGVNFNSQKGFESCTVTVNMDAISIINYDVDLDQKIKMFNIGFDAVINKYKV